MKTKNKISIIIPCYNEENNLKKGVLREVSDYLKKQKFSWEVIISDDGSTDQSKKLVEEFIKKETRFRFIKNPHGGKPFAIRSGVEKAKGEICLFTDMDQSTPILETDKLLPFFEQGFDIVIGSRGKERKKFPWYRKILSWGFRNLRLREIADTQCGFKSFRTEAGKNIFERMTVFQKKGKGWRVGAWDVEFLFVAKKLGYKIKEVPVTWIDKDIAKGKKKNFLRESKEMLLEIMRVKINDLRGKYNVNQK